MPQNYTKRRAHPYRSLADYNSSAYPGAAPSLDPLTAEATSLVPYNPSYNQSYNPGGALETVNPVSQPSSSGGAGGLLGNLPNLGELKGIIDRMGGIDGVINTLGKVQKVVTSFQQFAPMAKLIMGALPFGGKASNKAASDYVEYIPKRRKRKKSSSRKRGTSKSSRSSTKRKKR
ncbi:tyrosine protein kinase [Paenibacillus jiagnxiensis]|uniref:tyrosine protein kinase n=1 Tax=Paenibacillus jiagnxiensis TaxID=3228926 RepID=UPI0033AB71F6